MNVSSQDDRLIDVESKGPKARTRRLMLATAAELMQRGVIPSVSDVAEAAEVSRATAYRYFPNQAALVQAVVEVALGPILDWKSSLDDPEQRIEDLFDFSMPRIEQFEATFRAALKLGLEQWAQRQAGTLGESSAVRRGNRIPLLDEVLAPLRSSLSRDELERLRTSLSLVFGIEPYVVLKDICKLDSAEAHRVMSWTACAILRAALAEHAAASPRPVRRLARRS